LFHEVEMPQQLVQQHVVLVLLEQKQLELQRLALRFQHLRDEYDHRYLCP
jgi:hypothetical protein